HHVDMIRFLLGGNIKSVLGRTWNVPGHDYAGDPNVHAHFEMENGVPVFYLGSLMSAGYTSPWEGSWRIQCERGSIHLDDLGDGYGVYVVGMDGVKSKAEVTETPLDSIHGALAEFASSIREGRESATSGEDNLNTLAALFATSASSEQGRRLEVRP